MIKNIWHSTLIMAFIGFAFYILSATEDCERVDRTVSPVRGVAHVVSWASRNWLEQNDTTGIEETGAEAARYLARAISKTFHGDGRCSFPDPVTIRAGQSPQVLPAATAPINVPSAPIQPAPVTIVQPTTTSIQSVATPSVYQPQSQLPLK